LTGDITSPVFFKVETLGFGPFIRRERLCKLPKTPRRLVERSAPDVYVAVR
jgi:hypothetical protein